MNSSSLLIVVKSKEQSDDLMKIEELCSHPVTIELHRTLNTTKGTVISETMAQSTVDEIQEQLRDQGVIKVERMKRWQDRQLVDTNRFILTFSGSYLPSLITITQWQQEIVERYIPKPLQCTKCFRLGHTKNFCRHKDGEDFCRKCSQQGHLSGDCPNDPFCINCKGDHQPTDKQCDNYKLRCEILATQAKCHITRKEAEDQVRASHRDERKTYRAAVLRNMPPQDPPATSINNSITINNPAHPTIPLRRVTAPNRPASTINLDQNPPSTSTSAASHNPFDSLSVEECVEETTAENPQNDSLPDDYTPSPIIKSNFRTKTNQQKLPSCSDAIQHGSTSSSLSKGDKTLQKPSKPPSNQTTTATLANTHTRKDDAMEQESATNNSKRNRDQTSPDASTKKHRTQPNSSTPSKTKPQQYAKIPVLSNPRVPPNPRNHPQRKPTHINNPPPKK